jgi:hypothetical protein
MGVGADDGGKQAKHRRFKMIDPGVAYARFMKRSRPVVGPSEDNILCGKARFPSRQPIDRMSTGR